MVHPRDLLRTDLDDGHYEFSAPVDNINSQFDCGLAALPCWNKKLEKYAKPGIFAFVLSFSGFFHGVILNYFRNTSQIWGKHYNISLETIDWLIYTNEFFVGLFALAVSYWGNKIHRPSWLGALTIFVTVAGFCLSVPEIYDPLKNKEISNITEASLCKKQTTDYLHEETAVKEFNIIAFALIIVYQIFFAMASVSYVSHGITYLDDNISPRNSPGFIAFAITGLELGKHIGIYFAWAPIVFNLKYVFLSPVWFVIIFLTFVSGSLITLFPKVLPNAIVKKASASLLNVASGYDDVPEDNVDGFLTTIKRIMKNKIFLINTVAIVILQAALVNFATFEKVYNQAKYYIASDSSGYNDDSLIQFTSTLLRQPIIAFSTIAAGLTIAKLNPRAKYLIIWNITVLILCVIFFASTSFWKCNPKLENEHSSLIITPYCSSNCVCPQNEPFRPVCLNGKTYYSPCKAGCESKDPETLKYQNCRCSTIQNKEGVDGSCSRDKCFYILAFTQVNSVITSGLLATIIVSNLIITLRCIDIRDKATALGFQGTLISLITYLPFKSTYAAIIGNFCHYSIDKSCQIYSNNASTFLSVSTIVCMLLSAILTAVLLLFVKNLELYKYPAKLSEKKIEPPSLPSLSISEESSLTTPMVLRREPVETAPTNENNQNSGTDQRLIYSRKTVDSNKSDKTVDSIDSLKDLASDVGDDHDSHDELMETNL